MNRLLALIILTFLSLPVAAMSGNELQEYCEEYLNDNYTDVGKVWNRHKAADPY